MMDLLLDTHVAIWWMEGSDRLGAQCKAALFEPRARLWISTASVWEMAIKSGLGRLRLSTPLEECIPELLARGAHAKLRCLSRGRGSGLAPPPCGRWPSNRGLADRSEERRVGKECRSRGSP